MSRFATQIQRVQPHLEREIAEGLSCIAWKVLGMLDPETAVKDFLLTNLHEHLRRKAAQSGGESTDVRDDA